MKTNTADNLQKGPEKVRDNNGSLQKTITDLREKLYEINEKLKDSEALKSHFISNITNEIVNPFTSIMGHSKSILALGENKISEARKMAEMIYTEAFALDFQLKNIFAAAKLEAGETFPEISNIDIQVLIRDVIESFKLESENKHIQIVADLNLVNADTTRNGFKSDPEKLTIILSNVLSNSIKYSPENSEVKIEVDIQKGNLTLSVADSGKGINHSERQAIFNRFKQLDPNINSINKGHGLGLAVTRALIDVLEGDIEIVGEENKGTRFIITIPGQINNAPEFISGNEVLFNNDGIF